MCYLVAYDIGLSINYNVDISNTGYIHYLNYDIESTSN